MHCKFKCITVNFDKTQHGIYTIHNFIISITKPVNNLVSEFPKRWLKYTTSVCLPLGSFIWYIGLSYSELDCFCLFFCLSYCPTDLVYHFTATYSFYFYFTWSFIILVPVFSQPWQAHFINKYGSSPQIFFWGILLQGPI